MFDIINAVITGASEENDGRLSLKIIVEFFGPDEPDELGCVTVTSSEVFDISIPVLIITTLPAALFVTSARAPLGDIATPSGSLNAPEMCPTGVFVAVSTIDTLFQ